MKLDPRLTASALAHLLENAAQYSPPGSPIAVEATVSEGDVLRSPCAIEGPAIAPGDLPHLFERFYRGANTKGRVVGHRHGPRRSPEDCWPPRTGPGVGRELRSDGGARFYDAVPVADARAVAAIGMTTRRARPNSARRRRGVHSAGGGAAACARAGITVE